jgi:type I restriction enzyme S subunit
LKPDWSEAALGEVATINRQAVKPADIPDGTLYVGLENIERGGAFRNVGTVSRGELASTKFAFDASNILYGKLRPNLGKIARPRFDGVCSTDILPIAPGSTIDRDYLAHFLARPKIVQLATDRAAGANLPRISPKELERFRVVVPPLPEQRQITKVLDAAHALREKRQSALSLAKAIIASVFVSMFGDPVTNPRGWPSSDLGSLGKLERGLSRHRPRNAPELLDGPYPLIQTGDVARSEGLITGYSSTYSDAGLRQSRLWPAGTLCITIAANIAKAGMLTFDACFPDSVVGFTANPVTSTYVQAWLSFLQPTLERSAPESAQKNINLAILRQLPVPTPPHQQQAVFADTVELIRAVQRLHTTSLMQLDALFASLQHRAFNSEL